jgi:hypothetical protein
VQLGVVTAKVDGRFMCFRKFPILGILLGQLASTIAVRLLVALSLSVSLHPGCIDTFC